MTLTRWTFVVKVMSPLFNMLYRLVITFLPRSKRLLISWLQSPSAVILEPPKIKSDTVSTVSPSISHGVMGPNAMIFIFWMLSFKPTFSLSIFTFIKRLVLSKALIQLSADGWHCAPSLLVGLIMISKRTYIKGPLPGLLLPVPPSLQQATANPCFHKRLSNTSR